MDGFFFIFRSHKRHLKAFSLFFVLFFLLVFVAFGSGCQKAVNYFDYVSELRNNILLASDETFSLRVHSVEREIPYLADGIPKEKTTLTEVRLDADGQKSQCTIEFSYNGKTYGGEASYDNVKSEYFYSCSLDTSKAKEILFKIRFDDTVCELNAKSVLDENALSPKKVLSLVQVEEKQLFSALTDKYGFKGEIYLRLLYEDAPYYYVGIVSREKKTVAFLLNAKTGKILARREA